MQMFRTSGGGYAALLVGTILTTGCGSLHVVKTTGDASRSAREAGNSSPSDRSARPSKTLAMTLESQDGRLAAAILAVGVAPRADTYRQLAREYRRLGVLDKAHEHFSNAVAVDPTDASSYDALARIWRDWGTAYLGLGDAYRAVYYAPGSAPAANTLGTLLQATGHLEEAKLWYARAIHLDKEAWYALNNLCYAEVLTRQAAVNTCQAAVAAAPGNKAVVPQNNLALAHVAAGDRNGARQWFRRAGEPATASYNYGIAMMATRAYEEAAAAFDEAVKADPRFTLAAKRAQQARLAAGTEGKNAQ
jgi:tetratricopeptide (TPR) repeat protein